MTCLAHDCTSASVHIRNFLEEQWTLLQDAIKTHNQVNNA